MSKDREELGLGAGVGTDYNERRVMDGYDEHDKRLGGRAGDGCEGDQECGDDILQQEQGRRCLEVIGILGFFRDENEMSTCIWNIDARTAIGND